MSNGESRNETSAADIAAFTQNTTGLEVQAEITHKERNDELLPSHWSRS